MIGKPREVHQPRQRRSRETFDRILDATEGLFDGRDFEEISVNEICIAADVSASSFYARFPTKGVLLQCLHDRHLERVQTTIDEVASAYDWDRMPVRDVVVTLVRIYLANRRRNEPLLRTLMLAELREPTLSGDRVQLDRYGLEVIGAYLLARLDREGDFEFRIRLELAIRVLCAAMQDAMNAPHTFADHTRIDDDRLADELTGMMMRYLELADPGEREPASS